MPISLQAWRGELVNRLQAYRVRRRTISPNANQIQPCPLPSILFSGIVTVRLGVWAPRQTR